MKRLIGPLFLALILSMGYGATTVQADGGYTVKAGDTLLTISARYDVSPHTLAQANGLRWNDWLYVGQQITIPGKTTAVPVQSTQPTQSEIYVVRPGDTLYGIALRHGVSAKDIQSANNLASENFIFSGQRLTIPHGGSSNSWRGSNVYPSAGAYEKWIDINLTSQTVTAYQGNTPIKTVLVSTGLYETPTVEGTFQIYGKSPSMDMSGVVGGESYHVPNVPDVMFFYEGYALHGAYWHYNFGSRMSHGCVNMKTADAKWLYDWAPIGTTVVSHR